uniref:Signal-induced proliferation-associated 1 n=1 Tax=Scleropages formosus TaxID=113540 RepID=A0A8C9VZJ4_SCLFO
MQSDDLFIRKFRRQSPRPPVASVSFDPKREGGVRTRVAEWPPRKDEEATGGEGLTASRTGLNLRLPQPGPGDNLGGGAWVRNFAHYDVQSILFDLVEVASSRSGGGPEDPEQSLLPLDEGDGNGNDLLLSCPHFRNEMGGEQRPGLGCTRGPGGMRLSLRIPNDAVSVLEEPRESHVQQQGKSNYFIEHADLGAHYYRKYFYMKDHQNFFGMDERLGPVAISFRREEKEGSSGAQYNYRIIFRTTELKTLRGSILEESVPSAARHATPRGLSPKRLLEHIIPDLNLHCLRLASTSPKVRDTLLKLDEQGLNFQRKVGVMYCRASQSSEEDMYNNESAGPAFEEFLDLLGERVRLRGFEKYRAQLDTKTDSTGTHSLYTRYQDYEIMFHVSTMLPYTANNTQQLLRKRHIGNDIVTIVFQEPGALPFTPKAIRSHFQHVFIVVQVHYPCTDRTYYRVAVTRSKDIPLFGPLFPKGAHFPRSPAFRDFLLAKAVNAENAAEKSEKFRSMATRTRQEYLKDLAENYVTTTPIDSSTNVPENQLVTRGCEAKEVSPMRDSAGQPGFLLSEEGFVTELQRFGYADSGGLQLGARVVRLCGQPLVSLDLEARTNLLRSAHKIQLTVIPPDENGKPRRNIMTCLCSLSVLSETSQSSEKEWQSIADLAAACRSILEALSRDGGHKCTIEPPPTSHFTSPLTTESCSPIPHQEKEDKAVLQAEVQSLRQNNQRLQEESQSTVARLIKIQPTPHISLC